MAANKNNAMCYTAKGYGLAILAAIFAALFVTALVSGYNTQQAGLTAAAIVHYFIAFVLLGVAKHLVCAANGEKGMNKPRKARRR